MNKLCEKVLTVSVAAYNAEQYLREVLDSFVDIPQMDKIEVFVVDDGGTDNSLAIAKEYQSKYPQTFIPVHKMNGGWGSTVNYSINHAHGKYFKLLDGDDYYDKVNLSKFIDYLNIIDADIVVSPFISFEDISRKKVETFSPDSSYKTNTVYNIEKVQNEFPLAMHAFAVRTELIQSHGIRVREKYLYRDMEFTSRCIECAETIMFFDKPVYFYRLGREGQSVSKSSYLKHIDEHADIVITILNISKNCSNNKKRILYDLARGACVQQYVIYFYTSKTKSMKMKLIEFDRIIQEYPDFYKSIVLPWHIHILRKLRFNGYEIVMKLLGIKRFVQGKN